MAPWMPRTREQAASPMSACGATLDTICWRGALRALKRVHHRSCAERNGHPGACYCATCGTVIATRQLKDDPELREYYYNSPFSSRVPEAVHDAVARRTSNAKVRGGLKGFAIRLFIVGIAGGGLSRIGGAGLAVIVTLLVIIILTSVYLLTRDES